MISPSELFQSNGQPINQPINQVFSPRTFLKRMYDRLPCLQGKKHKITKETFTMLSFSEYNDIVKNNYNVLQLKQMCKHYNQKVSGNKEELRRRMYNYLKYSASACIIQKEYKRHITQRYIKSHGPAFFTRKKCVNEVDFLTLSSIQDIPHYQFFSYRDKDDFMYCFDICSLYNLFKNSNNHPKNPFNRNDFPPTIIQDLRTLIRLCKVMSYPVKLILDKDTTELSFEQQVIVKINSVFQKIDQLGNYTDSAWFIQLNRPKLIMFVRELYDIWTYRSQLTHETKISICPPIGNPFNAFQMSGLYMKNITQIRKSVIHIIDILVTRGIDSASRNLGAYYCLGALTLVNQGAADALPWLYESVMYTPQHPPNP